MSSFTIELDEDGSIRRLGANGLELVSGPAAKPWVLHLADGTTIDEPASTEVAPRDAGYALRWTTERGDVIDASITISGDEARFRVAVTGEQVDGIDYPVIGGVGALSDDDELVHGYATGLLFHNPFTLFDGDTPGVRHAPYPESFSGASLQLMTYYAVGRGGFAFSSDDASGAQKWFNFYKDGEHLRVELGHGTGDLDAPLRPGYDMVVSALGAGTWTEAADRYKAWAVQQRWCARGLVADDPKRDRRFYEEVGIATFGINAAENRTSWIERIRDIAGRPVLHVLGPNWTNRLQDYRGGLPGGLDDWFPARFDEANLRAMRAAGDLVVPFYFDLLFGRGGADEDEGVAALQQIPKPARSTDEYTFPFLCPATPFFQELHARRDERLVRAYGVDGVYYDISANNVLKQCYAAAHGHPRGGGAFLVDAYRQLFAVPEVTRGTEMVNEVFLDQLDFYQARAEGSPVATFEADRFRKWMVSGEAEKVPLFTYVYHEYGPVRLDGWAKLSRETGDLFYWIAARILCWGGLLELNYEFSPLENVDGEREPLDEHYASLPDHRYEIDPGKAAFVGEIARARAGNPYLAYGTMMPPLAIDSPTVELDWFHYNGPQEWPSYEDRGTKTVPAVVHQAWRFRDKVAVVLVNISEQDLRVTVPLEEPVEVELPSRRVVLVGDVLEPGGGVALLVDLDDRKV
ncbi:MAG TPA: DUF6259 domain-containing protein [Gaiellaceae bacterium]|nr:DUF6259 domain-containing protein [Gaiellaceae bacterium]